MRQVQIPKVSDLTRLSISDFFNVFRKGESPFDTPLTISAEDAIFFSCLPATTDNMYAAIQYIASKYEAKEDKITVAAACYLGLNPVYAINGYFSIKKVSPLRESSWTASLPPQYT